MKRVKAENPTSEGYCNPDEELIALDKPILAAPRPLEDSNLLSPLMHVDSEQEAESQPDFLDSPVWKAAYRKYRRFWLNLARGQQLSEDEAKDVLHSVLCSIVTDIAAGVTQFTSVEHLRNYVSRSVLNRSVIARRESGRKVSWNETLEGLNPVLNEAEDEERDLRDAIREGLRELSGTAFQIIKLRFYSGLTFSEVSQMLNLPLSTIKSREEAAIKKIRKALRKRGF